MRTLIAGPAAAAAVIALSAAVAGSSITPGQAATRPTCLKQSGTTLRSNTLVRVYETEPDTSEDGTLSRLWACQAGSTHRVELADAYENPFGEEQAYSSVRLAGRRVAFVLTSASYEGEILLKLTREVTRIDLARDHTDSATVAAPVRLVMSRSGGVAWIEAGAVRALTPPGARTLDPGPVRPGSLKASGRSSITWERDGERHSAAISQQ